MRILNRKGFTLAELLIVMAIIVVLAAVAIPTFTRQLETSRETADLETLRNAYTEAFTQALADVSDNGVLDTADKSGTSGSYKITSQKLVQTQAGFQYVKGSIGAVDVSASVPANCVAHTADITFIFEISTTSGTEGDLKLTTIEIPAVTT